MENLDLILLAAGKAERLAEPVPKQFADLAGQPIIVRALNAFEKLDSIGTKYIVVPADYLDVVNPLLRNQQITDCMLVRGGETRQESVRLGLAHVKTKRVITHNAALPFVTPSLVDNVVRNDYACVTTVTPVQQSLCWGDEFAREMVPLEHLQMINTPQSFDTEALRECHRRALADQVVAKTDCELMLRYGYQVKFVQGTTDNFKITTPLDMVLARALASAKPKRGA